MISLDRGFQDEQDDDAVNRTSCIPFWEMVVVVSPLIPLCPF